MSRCVSLVVLSFCWRGLRAEGAHVHGIGIPQPYQHLVRDTIASMYSFIYLL